MLAVGTRFIAVTVVMRWLVYRLSNSVYMDRLLGQKSGRLREVAVLLVEVRLCLLDTKITLKMKRKFKFRKGSVLILKF